jgi:hypothetical protein
MPCYWPNDKDGEPVSHAAYRHKRHWAGQIMPCEQTLVSTGPLAYRPAFGTFFGATKRHSGYTEENLCEIRRSSQLFLVHTSETTTRGVSGETGEPKEETHAGFPGRLGAMIVIREKLLAARCKCRPRFLQGRM